MSTAKKAKPQTPLKLSRLSSGAWTIYKTLSDANDSLHDEELDDCRQALIQAELDCETLRRQIVAMRESLED